MKIVCLLCALVSVFSFFLLQAMEGPGNQILPYSGQTAQARTNGANIRGKKVGNTKASLIESGSEDEAPFYSPGVSDTEEDKECLSNKDGMPFSLEQYKLVCNPHNEMYPACQPGITVQKILQAGFSISQEDLCAALAANKRDRVELKSLLRELQATSSAKKIDPQDELHNGIFNDSAVQVQEAIKLDADPNREMESPLGAGSGRGNREDYKQSPLMLAFLLQHQHAIQALLNSGAQPDEKLIRKAIGDGYFDNALLFLKKKPTISAEGIAVCMSDCQRMRGRSSPLASNQQPTVLEVMQQLINLGYNVNHIWFSETRGGSPELYWNDNVLKLFLKNDANPNCMYIHGAYSTTPLFQAIYHTRNNKANLSGIKILLDSSGARVNQKANPLQNSGRPGAITPLAFAKRKGVTPDLDVIKLLQERGGTL